MRIVVVFALLTMSTPDQCQLDYAACSARAIAGNKADYPKAKAACVKACVLCLQASK